MALEGQVGQMEMKCIFDIGKKFYMGQGFSGEQCGPWASCFIERLLITLIFMNLIPTPASQFGL
jgi:hypothetical protein